jgi:hypothetical protein
MVSPLLLAIAAKQKHARTGVGLMGKMPMLRSGATGYHNTEGDHYKYEYHEKTRETSVWNL